MLPDPLHPALVHIPLGIAVLSPAAALGVAWAIRRSSLPAGAWVAVVATQAVLMGSVLLAAQTGEREEERIERVVAERHIEAHEERAERLLIASALAFVLAAMGLSQGTAGRVGRAATVVATVPVLVAAIQVGHSGGELVYRHGAASAYLDDAEHLAHGPLEPVAYGDDD